MRTSKKASSRFVRSANLERDGSAANLADYIPTPRALELVERVVEALETGCGAAISVVGAYGSGKSSAAVFLQALLGPLHEQARNVAAQKLLSSDRTLSRRLHLALQSHARKHGFIRAAAVAQREPVARTLLRGLNKGFTTAGVARRLPRVTHPTPDPGRILAAIDAARGERPILVLVDEFGKNLEHYVEDPSHSDLFVLQQLAERAASTSEPPLVLVTLQHLAIDEYLATCTPQAQREWAKIQGRFSDLSFSESPKQVRRLIAAALTKLANANPLPASIVEAHFSEVQRVGLSEYFETAAAIAATQPLHPVAVASLPDLCARYAQNERTLFSFLRSDERGSLPEFIRTRSASGRRATLGADGLYDYFLESARSQLMAARGARRWLEIESRIREAQPSLNALSLKVLKTIGTLNLVSAGGPLRASSGMVQYACLDDPRDAELRNNVANALEELVRHGVLTFRSFADEFRIWAGSDFDLAAAFEESYREASRLSLATTLQSVRPQSPIVAGQFSIETGTLRAFYPEFADDLSVLASAQPSPPYDGLVALWVGATPVPNATDPLNSGPRPVILALPSDPVDLRRTALEVAAYRRILERNPQLAEDWVARREVVERLVIAEQRLDSVLWRSFWSEQSGARYRVITPTSEKPRRVRLSRIASSIAKSVYHAAPRIPNEVLNRHELSSQGAAARRTLVEAMILHNDELELGLQGFGPERSMYLALLLEPGIHRCTDGEWRFGPPKRGSSIAAAWRALSSQIGASCFKRVRVDELFDMLAAPPFGLRQGPWPVLFTAVVLSQADDIALYEHGVYQPILAPDLIERLAKNPKNFEVRSFGLARGARLAVIREAAYQFKLVRGQAKDHRHTVLSVVRSLLNTFRSLPEFALATRSVSVQAIAVRDSFLNANEPDQLIFVALPQALSFAPFGSSADEGKTVGPFVEALGAALRELREAYPRVLGEIRAVGAEQLQVAPTEFRAALRERSAHLLARAGHPALRSFLLTAQDVVQPDDDWLQNLAVSLSSRAPRSWRDDDVLAVKTALLDRLGALRRLEFLYAETASARAPYRISLTEPDGTERALVGFATASEDAVREIASDAVQTAEAAVGPAAGPALVRALLKLLGDPVSATESA